MLATSRSNCLEKVPSFKRSLLGNVSMPSSCEKKIVIWSLDFLNRHRHGFQSSWRNPQKFVYIDSWTPYLFKTSWGVGVPSTRINHRSTVAASNHCSTFDIYNSLVELAHLYLMERQACPMERGLIGSQSPEHWTRSTSARVGQHCCLMSWWSTSFPPLPSLPCSFCQSQSLRSVWATQLRMFSGDKSWRTDSLWRPSSQTWLSSPAWDVSLKLPNTHLVWKTSDRRIQRIGLTESLKDNIGCRAATQLQQSGKGEEEWGRKERFSHALRY